jgi:hypothetical protein
VVDLQKSGLLYGNDNMYYFLRYHRYLYERMAAARKCCAEKFKPQFKQTAFQTVVPAKQEVRVSLAGGLADKQLESATVVSVALLCPVLAKALKHSSTALEPSCSHSLSAAVPALLDRHSTS